ncbi:MAG: ABC transporter permease subunit [Lentisphaeraceae bacterium]|nr:ABC transporter permease subunit [Lentisphaeraceae bacterium]
MPIIPYGAHYISPIDKAPLDKRIEQIDVLFKPHFEKLESQELSAEDLQKRKHDLNIKLTEKKGAIEKLNYHPLPPDFSTEHYMGTDTSGRDIFSRLMYGYRIAISFALILLLINYVIGVSIGCLMGYLGGVFDLVVQRVIEVISNVPFLYVIMIIGAVMRERKMEMGFWTLIGVYAMFGWMGMTWSMRTTTFTEKSREYILAARANGATNTRIIFNHILPNVVSLLVTFIPFSISGAIVGLTSLDYLGYGLPKGTPSWGELIKLGTEDMNSPWIVLSVVSAMILVLFLINSVGEAVREAFDPKKISTYE